MILAQITDSLIQAIGQGGPMLALVALLIYRDGKDRERLLTRDAAREERLSGLLASRETAWLQRDEKRDHEITKLREEMAREMGKMRDAVTHLVQVTASEVLTRPAVKERIRRDTEEIFNASKKQETE